MKKWNNTISFTLDKIFWYILYVLPVILYLISGNGVLFDTFLSQIGFTLSEYNPVLSVLSQLFGNSGLLPLFTSDGLLVICSWFVSVFLVHLCVDFLLFIPRLAHRWSGKVYQDED